MLVTSRVPFGFLLAFTLGSTTVAFHDFNAQNISEAFLKWMKEQNKFYDTEEELLHREKIFAKNLAKIEEHNADKTNTYEMGLNSFSDMEFEEFRNLYLMTPQNCSATNRKRKTGTNYANFPPSFDWRTKGVVTPVKNQGNCGSCWTFSTTGALESHHAIATGNLISLSEQQLVDCAHRFNTYGCDGGLPSEAFEYIHYNGGIESEESYPYTAKTGTCSFNRSRVVATDKQSFNITEGDEEEIFESVALKGPVSIAYDCAKDFMHYKKGVYRSKICHQNTQSVNHAVLAVGYGQTDDGLKYWIVKNSWGESWGMDGYFWIERGVNMCGLAECASYPLV